MWDCEYLSEHLMWIKLIIQRFFFPDILSDAEIIAMVFPVCCNTFFENVILWMITTKFILWDNSNLSECYKNVPERREKKKNHHGNLIECSYLFF